MSVLVHFSSASDEWATPNRFYSQVVARFGQFDLDPCCLPSSARAPTFYTSEDNVPPALTVVNQTQEGDAS